MTRHLSDALIPATQLPSTLQKKVLTASVLSEMSAKERAIYEEFKYKELYPQARFVSVAPYSTTHFSASSPRIFENEHNLKAHKLLELEEVSARDGGRKTSARAVRPPITNRGGKVATISTFEDMQIVTVKKGGRPVIVCIPKPDKGMNVKHSFIDWVNFTFKKSSLDLNLETGHAALCDDDYITAFSPILNSIFGYCVTFKRSAGLNFYKSAFDLGINGWGHVCIGGQKDSVLVSIKGQGIMGAAPGWEKRLYDFLNSVHGAKLTRVDFASDNFNSKRTLDDYLDYYHAGLFTSSGRPPNVEQAGNWIKPNGKGRTLYIGSRSAGKLLRIYEKGLQLANGFHEKYPRWLRVELELNATDRVIPFDSLLKPGQYLAGAYPALQHIHLMQDRVKTQKKTVKSTIEKSIEVTRHQFGKYIWTFSQLHGIEKAFELITRGKEEIPQKLLSVSETYQQFDSSLLIKQKPLTTFEAIQL